MKTVLLVGGLGTRLSEEMNIRLEPIIPFGGRPILSLIMKIYSASGINLLRDGLAQIHFADRDFCNSQHIRLKMLGRHIASGWRLPNLRWAGNTAHGMVP